MSKLNTVGSLIAFVNVIAHDREGQFFDSRVSRAGCAECILQGSRDVNETLKPETETRPRLLAFSPR